MFSAQQIAELEAPLNKSNVKQRSQAGRQVSYVEGWHAIEEANRIFGFDAWDRETVDLREVGQPREVDGKWRVAYMARVRITVRSESDGQTIRDGCGYGSGIDRDLGQAHESALKEAETDAMKRALMTFGNPFGLALYDKEQKNVEGEPPRTAAQRQQERSQSRRSDPVDEIERFNDERPQDGIKTEDQIRNRIRSLKTIQAVTDYMLKDETQTLLESLPEGVRDGLRDAAKARLVELGWPTKKEPAKTAAKPEPQPKAAQDEGLQETQASLFDREESLRQANALIKSLAPVRNRVQLSDWGKASQRIIPRLQPTDRDRVKSRHDQKKDAVLAAMKEKTS